MNGTEDTYKIIRFLPGNNKRGEIRKTGLTRQEALEHCERSEVLSNGRWFDKFQKEDVKNVRLTPSCPGCESRRVLINVTVKTVEAMGFIQTPLCGDIEWTTIYPYHDQCTGKSMEWAFSCMDCEYKTEEFDDIIKASRKERQKQLYKERRKEG